jgi:hypothetical protein
MLTSEPQLIKTFNSITPKNTLKIGSWNVRTLNQTGKVEKINKEMKRYNLEILAIHEARDDHHNRPITPGVGRWGVKMDELISPKVLHCSLFSAMLISLEMLHFVHCLVLSDQFFR